MTISYRKLVLYPNGNKTKSVYDHISLYLRLADTSALRHGWELSAFCRLFLLDQKRIKYLVFQGCFLPLHLTL